MKKTEIKCPLCSSLYYKGVCSNLNCLLSFKEKNKFDWGKVYRNLKYPSLKDSYYYLKNRLFKRYDLIRTGLPKSQWIDIDHKMLHGVMGLIVDFIEKERGLEYIDYETSEEDKKRKKEIIDLYVDWKVRYPKLLEEENLKLKEWASGQDTKWSEIEERPKTYKLEWVYHRDKATQDKLFEELNQLEKDVYEMEQNMLHRMIEIRASLWT